VFLWQVFNDKIQSDVQLKREIGQVQLNAKCVAVKNPLTIFSSSVWFLNFVGVSVEIF
jgi:hypothetical protein